MRILHNRQTTTRGLVVSVAYAWPEFQRFGGDGEGDCRDWEKIHEWARGVLADRLRAAVGAKALTG